MAEPAAKKARTENGEETKEDVEMAAVGPAQTGEVAKDAPTTEEAVRELPKVNEPPRELEEDAAISNNPKILEPVVFHVQDTTMNLMASSTGNLFKALSDGGFQYLFAGARANVGVKAGRYMFEVKILESVYIQDHDSHGRAPKPKNLLRVGFSTEGARLFLGDQLDSIGFDSEGNLLNGKMRTTVTQRCWRDSVLGVLLNLDAESPNFNTVSLFKDGRRACAPQKLPESLCGRTLYPTIAFRNMTVHVNFGPVHLAPLPFSCRMLGTADKKDVAVIPAPPEPKDGLYEVLFPMTLPDEGPFDWLDLFLEKNPDYTEISDRVIVDWCQESGARRQVQRSSTDKPEYAFGVPQLDDMSVRRLLQLVAPVQRRNFVVMEVRGNLIQEERQQALERFAGAPFRKVALLAIGEPSLEFKKRTHELMRKAKQEASDAEFRVKRAEAARKRALEKQHRELKRRAERERKQIEKERKRIAKAAEEEKRKTEAEMRAKAEAEMKAKAEEEMKAKAEEEMKAKAEAEAQAKDGETAENVDQSEKAVTVDEEMKAKEPAKAEAEEKQETAKGEGEDMQERAKAEGEEKQEEEEDDACDQQEEEEDEVEPMNEEPPRVELTAEEKAMHFRKPLIPDVAPLILSATFAKFTLPSKDEGFDEMRYEWSRGEKCKEHLRQWTLEKKLSTRVEDIKPSTWFLTQYGKWQQTLRDWGNRHAAWKAAEARKAIDAAAAAAAKAKEKAAKEASDKEAADKAAQDAGQGDAKVASGDLQKAEPTESAEKANEDASKIDVAKDVEEEKVDEKKEDDDDFEEIDVFAVEDVNAVGGKEMPLYREFKHEDWAMLGLRFELHLLAHAFKRDVDDLERTGIKPEHLGFYYNRYYRKLLNPQFFGVKDAVDLVGLVRDALYITKQQVIESQLPGELESFGLFIKLTEEDRRYRQLRVDVGEETAKLNVQQLDAQGDHRGDVRKGGGGKAQPFRDNRGSQVRIDTGGKAGKDWGGRGHRYKGGKDLSNGVQLVVAPGSAAQGGKATIPWSVGHTVTKGGRDGRKGGKGTWRK